MDVDRTTSSLTTRQVAIAVIVALGLVAILVVTYRSGRATPRGQFVSYTEEIMATPITVALPYERSEHAGLVFEVFRTVDERMSEWKSTSPLSEVNTAAGERAVAVPDDLRAVIRRGIEIGDMTDGAFDVTWAALWGLWDFKAVEPTVPDAGRIAAAQRLVDYRRVEIDDEAGTVRLPEAGMLIGLGGIAKGHALDRAAAALRAAGVRDFLISAGGHMMVGGRRGDRPWRIGVRNPRGAPGDAFARLEVTNTSVSSSGDYERFFVIDGVRYHHILDPRTGYPARGARAATVVAADATLADALSTALLILGPERGLEIVESLDGVEALIVDPDGALHVSTGLEGRVEMLD